VLLRGESFGSTSRSASSPNVTRTKPFGEKWSNIRPSDQRNEKGELKKKREEGIYQILTSLSRVWKKVVREEEAVVTRLERVVQTSDGRNEGVEGGKGKGCYNERPESSHSASEGGGQEKVRKVDLEKKGSYSAEGAGEEKRDRRKGTSGEGKRSPRPCKRRLRVMGKERRLWV